MEKIKKHYKEILIVLLVLFGMNKCASNCSNKQKAAKLTEIVNKNTIEIDSLKEELDRSKFTISLLNSNAKTAAEQQRQKFLLDSLDRINRKNEADARIKELRKLNERIDKATKESKQ